MDIKKEPYEELILKFGVVMEQIQVCKRGLKEHPTDEIFQKAILFMKDEAESLMKELLRRRNVREG